MSFKVKNTFQALVIALIFSVIMAGNTSAGEDSVNAAKYRQRLMETQEGHLLAIVALLKGEVSHADHVKTHAEAIKGLSEMIGDVFPKGSDVAGSRARPEIWQNWDKFRAAYDNYKAEVAKLAEVAAGGDLGAVGAQLGKLGEACSGCHKPFRKPKQ